MRKCDDWLLMISGTREHAEQMRENAAAMAAKLASGFRLKVAPA